MKLFVLLSRIPYPLEKGDKLRAFNHLKYLSKKNEIVLCALNDTELHKDAIKILGQYCKSIHIIKLSKAGILLNLILTFFNGLPFQTGYFYSRKAQRKINRILEEENPDHIFCQLLRVAGYVKNQPTPKTLDYQDVFSKGIERRIKKSPFYMKPLLRLEYRRLLKYENYIFDFFDNKTIISKPDRDLIPHPDKEKIHVIPNGVDTDYFYPVQSRKEYDIVFIGNMGYPPNVDAAEYLANKIFPLVLEKNPEVKLLLAGASPDKRVQALRSENIHVSGWVEDIRDCYAKARIFIAPMQIGTGLQNKLLEAMAMKIPCITSPLANSALGAKPGKEILTGNNPIEFANSILFLLNNPEPAEKLAKAGYYFVLNNYNWEPATKVLEGIMKYTL